MFGQTIVPLFISLQKNNTSQQMVLVILFLLLQTLTLWCLLKVKRLSLPIYTVNITYLATGILGYATYTLFPDFGNIGFTSALILMNNDEAYLTLLYYLYFINTILFGAIVFSIIQKVLCTNKTKKSNRNYNPFIRNLALNKNLNLGTINIKLNFSVAVLFCVSSITLLVLGYGWENLLSAKYYGDIVNDKLVIVGSISILCTSVLIGYAFAEAKGLSKFLVLIILAAIHLIIGFSTGSRRLPLILVLIAVGYNFNNNKKKKIGKTLIIISLILSIPLFSIPLYLRSQEAHGFLPYVEALSKMSLNDFLKLNTGVFNNILFSFPLTFEVMKHRTDNFSLEYFFVAINPLPGFTTKWYEINDDLRVNYYTPFNTLGEVYLYGDFIAFIFFFAVGIAIMHVSVVVERNFILGRKNLAILLIALIALFVVNSLQYNIRNSMRLLYWALLFTCFDRE